MTRWALLLALAALAGCDDMTSQSKVKTYAVGGNTLQMPAGMVKFEDMPGAIPPLTLALIERGRDQFHIFCAPCHSELGDGNGMIVQRGFPQPPSFHIDRLRQAPPQHFYDVVTDGYGAMYSFASRIVPADRWAIAAYIKALQASQNATIGDVPADQRAALP